MSTRNSIVLVFHYRNQYYLYLYNCIPYITHAKLPSQLWKLSQITTFQETAWNINKLHLLVAKLYFSYKWLLVPTFHQKQLQARPTDYNMYIVSTFHVGMLFRPVIIWEVIAVLIDVVFKWYFGMIWFIYWITRNLEYNGFYFTCAVYLDPYTLEWTFLRFPNIQC